MSFRKSYVLVCQNRRPEGNPKGSCAGSGSEEIRAKLKELIEERGLSGDIRVIGTTCLDFCERGPVIAVFPEGIWYCRVSLDDLERIVEGHLIGGKPIESLRLTE